MEGKPGRFWDLNDPEVSAAIQPILRLVSRFIAHFDTCDWLVWSIIIMG